MSVEEDIDICILSCVMNTRTYTIEYSRINKYLITLIQLVFPAPRHNRLFRAQIRFDESKTTTTVVQENQIYFLLSTRTTTSKSSSARKAKTAIRGRICSETTIFSVIGC